MRVEVTILDLTTRGVHVRLGEDARTFWLPRTAPGMEWSNSPEIGDVVSVRVPSWLVHKHRPLAELQYQRSLTLQSPVGLDPEKAERPFPMADHTPSFSLTRLFRKTSKEGKTYFTGRLGGARIALLKSKDTAEDGGEIWNLVISEAPKRDDAGQRQEQQRQPQQPNAYATATGRTERQPERSGPVFDDTTIPF